MGSVGIGDARVWRFLVRASAQPTKREMTMEAKDLDALIRRLRVARSRRVALVVTAGGWLSLLGLGKTAARKRKRRPCRPACRLCRHCSRGTCRAIVDGSSCGSCLECQSGQCLPIPQCPPPPDGGDGGEGDGGGTVDPLCIVCPECAPCPTCTYCHPQFSCIPVEDGVPCEDSGSCLNGVCVP